MRIAISLLTFLLINSSVFAQQKTARKLSFVEFFNAVLDHHPIAKQARLVPNMAQQQLKIARGSFDPTFQWYENEKIFNSQPYYKQSNAFVKVPTWFGVEVKAGYEVNSGNRLNPEDYTPNEGLAYVGVNVPLARNLILDERRLQLKVAQQYVNISEQEQIKLLNKLLFTASKDYWDWYFAYSKMLNMQNAVTLAETRFLAVKERVKHGDLAGIDSTEAKIAFQQREISYRQAIVDFTNSQLTVSTHLWDENGNPLEINEGVLPQDFEIQQAFLELDSLSSILETANQKHPELLKLTYKAKQLSLENRYNWNNLLPIVNLNYNLLSTNPPNWSGINYAYLENYYKGGITAYMPLFLRKERGKLQNTRLKITENQLERDFANRDILNRINISWNENQLLRNQLSRQRNLISDYILLRDGEQNKFENGESSFFLINNRETQLIDSQLKLLEFETKFMKSKIEIQFQAGKLPISRF